MRFVVALVLVLSFLPFAHAGRGEDSVVSARANLSSLLRECRLMSCGLDVEEGKTLALIEAASVPAIVMKSYKEMGTILFVLDGAEVWINRDLLWVDEKRTIAFGLAHALSLWIEILATQESLDVARYDSIRAKILVAFAN